jgi:hypothetical protein
VDALDIWLAYLWQPESAGLLPPGLGNETIIRHLGLPALPNAVSCYYVCDSWARKEFNELVRRLDFAKKSSKKKVMKRLTPLLRAAILESIRYF